MSKQRAALSSATQHTLPTEFGGKWGTECLNTRLPLPTMLCAGYSVKLKKNYISHQLYTVQCINIICIYLWNLSSNHIYFIKRSKEAFDNNNSILITTTTTTKISINTWLLSQKALKHQNRRLLPIAVVKNKGYIVAFTARKSKIRY